MTARDVALIIFSETVVPSRAARIMLSAQRCWAWDEDGGA